MYGAESAFFFACHEDRRPSEREEKRITEVMKMACFLVSAAEAVVVTAVEKAEEKREVKSAPKAEQEAILAQDPEMKKNWDEKLGDRMVKLCIIGTHLDKEAISKQLDSALAN